VLTDNYGCKDSAQISIYVLCDKSNSIYIPNAFEPLSTNTRNAYFYVQGTGIKEVSFLRIYNRWGTELFFREHFQINKPELGWDGTFNGTKVTNDVYMYQMQIICANGTVFPISGNFTVIK
jgi:gliding motility-associated-like protein